MGHDQARWPFGRDIRRLSRIESRRLRSSSLYTKSLASAIGPRSLPTKLLRRVILRSLPIFCPVWGQTEDELQIFQRAGPRKRCSHLNPDQVTADLNAAADYAAKIPASNGKLFVAGFCWGGGQSFLFATNRADLSAAFVFYGPPPDKEAMARIKAPVYGFYGGNDARIDATIPATKDQMKEAGKTYEPVTYEGAGHGFMRAGEAPDASEPNRKARTDAWERWKKLLSGAS